MSSFKVGDIVEVIDTCGWAPGMRYMIGLETTILGASKMQGIPQRLRWPCHDPVHPTTGPFWIMTENLRLKRPPNKDEFTAGEWELCPWRPAKERVT